MVIQIDSALTSSRFTPGWERTRTVTGKGFDRAVVEFDFQHAGRTLQDFINYRIGFQPVAGGFDLFSRDFKRIEGFFCNGIRHFASFSQKDFQGRAFRSLL
nr:hypothetical protein [Neisseria gonorrhoeae]